MSEPGTILAIVEPDVHPAEVVARAAWLAKTGACRLDLLLCDPDVGPLRDGLLVSNEAREIARQIEAAQQEIIEDLAKPARDAGVEVSVGVLKERPFAEAIGHRIAEHPAQYVVKGTQYHNSAERSIFVDTDWQLVRSCPSPLWLVKPHEIRARPVVIAAVDPTHGHDKPARLDQVIIDNARRITDPTGGELHLVHTYHRMVGIGREATRTFKPITLPIEQISRKFQQEHEHALDSLAKKNRIEAEYVHLLPGNTRDLLPTFARSRGADLVVMGALARWGLKRAILGSTAERVLDHLPCDVLIVRMPDD